MTITLSKNSIYQHKARNIPLVIMLWLFEAFSRSSLELGDEFCKLLIVNLRLFYQIRVFNF